MFCCRPGFVADCQSLIQPGRLCGWASMLQTWHCCWCGAGPKGGKASLGMYMEHRPGAQKHCSLASVVVGWSQSLYLVDLLRLLLLACYVPTADCWWMCHYLLVYCWNISCHLLHKQSLSLAVAVLSQCWGTKVDLALLFRKADSTVTAAGLGCSLSINSQGCCQAPQSMHATQHLVINRNCLAFQQVQLWGQPQQIAVVSVIGCLHDCYRSSSG